MDQMQQESEQVRAELASKMDEYEKKKQLLKTVLAPDMLRRAEDYIENGSPSPCTQRTDIFNAANLFDSPVASTTNANDDVLHQLLGILIDDKSSSRGLSESVPSTSTSASHDISSLLQQQLNARLRQNSNSNTTDMFKLLEFLGNASSDTERSGSSVSNETDMSRQSTSGNAGSSNGFERFMSENASPTGQNAARYPSGRPFGESIAGPGVTRPFVDANLVNMHPSTRSYEHAGPTSINAGTGPYTEGLAGQAGIRPYQESMVGPSNQRPYGDGGPGAVGHPYAESVASPRYPLSGPAPTAQSMPPRQYHPGLCEGAIVPPNAPPAAGPPMYMPGTYSSPTQPPAPRQFYAHYPSNNMQNNPYPGIVMNQPPRQPMPPQNAPNNQYFMGGRYPSQHYYPPYQ